MGPGGRRGRAVSLSDERRLEELEAGLIRLRRDAEGAVLIVEGPKDAHALHVLGVGGAHRTLNRGVSLEVWMDRLVDEADAAGWGHAILLTDWDRTGGRLFRRLHDGLQARIPVDGEHRRRIARASRVRCVEDVPADLAALRRRAGSAGPMSNKRY